MNQSLSIPNRVGQMLLRIFTWITLFLGAYSMVQSCFVVLADLRMEEVSMLVVVIYLLVTPFSFLASIFFAIFVHQTGRGYGKDMQIVLGYALMVMAAVDNLIYVSIHHAGDALSFYILGGIEVICMVICFLYYQGIGNVGILLCGVILYVACTLLELEEAIRYFLSIQYYDFTGYYFAQTVLDFLLALIGLGFAIFVKNGIVQKR